MKFERLLILISCLIPLMACEDCEKFVSERDLHSTIAKLLLGGVDRSKLAQIQYMASDEYGNLNYGQLFDLKTGLMGLEKAHVECEQVKVGKELKESLTEGVRVEMFFVIGSTHFKSQSFLPKYSSPFKRQIEIKFFVYNPVGSTQISTLLGTGMQHFFLNEVLLSQQLEQALKVMAFEVPLSAEVGMPFLYREVSASDGFLKKITRRRVSFVYAPYKKQDFVDRSRKLSGLDSGDRFVIEWQHFTGVVELPEPKDREIEELYEITKTGTLSFKLWLEIEVDPTLPSIISRTFEEVDRRTARHRFLGGLRGYQMKHRQINISTELRIPVRVDRVLIDVNADWGNRLMKGYVSRDSVDLQTTRTVTHPDEEFWMCQIVESHMKSSGGEFGLYAMSGMIVDEQMPMSSNSGPAPVVIVSSPVSLGLSKKKGVTKKGGKKKGKKPFFKIFKSKKSKKQAPKKLKKIGKSVKANPTTSNISGGTKAIGDGASVSNIPPNTALTMLRVKDSNNKEWNSFDAVTAQTIAREILIAKFPVFFNDMQVFSKSILLQKKVKDLVSLVPTQVSKLNTLERWAPGSDLLYQVSINTTDLGLDISTLSAMAKFQYAELVSTLVRLEVARFEREMHISEYYGVVLKISLQTDQANLQLKPDVTSLSLNPFDMTTVSTNPFDMMGEFETQPIVSPVTTSLGVQTLNPSIPSLAQNLGLGVIPKQSNDLNIMPISPIVDNSVILPTSSISPTLPVDDTLLPTIKGKLASDVGIDSTNGPVVMSVTEILAYDKDFMTLRKFFQKPASKRSKNPPTPPRPFTKISNNRASWLEGKFEIIKIMLAYGLIKLAPTSIVKDTFLMIPLIVPSAKPTTLSPQIEHFVLIGQKAGEIFDVLDDAAIDVKLYQNASVNGFDFPRVLQVSFCVKSNAGIEYWVVRTDTKPIDPSENGVVFDMFLLSGLHPSQLGADLKPHAENLRFTKGLLEDIKDWDYVSNLLNNLESQVFWDPVKPPSGHDLSIISLPRVSSLNTGSWSSPKKVLLENFKGSISALHDVGLDHWKAELYSKRRIEKLKVPVGDPIRDPWQVRPAIDDGNDKYTLEVKFADLGLVEQTTVQELNTAFNRMKRRIGIIKQGPIQTPISTPAPKVLFSTASIMLKRDFSACEPSAVTFFKTDKAFHCQKRYLNNGNVAMEFGSDLDFFKDGDLTFEKTFQIWREPLPAIQEQQLSDTVNGFGKSAFAAKMKYVIRENYSLEISSLFDGSDTVANASIRLLAENAYFSRISGIRNRMNLNGTVLADFVRGILLRENRELSKPNGVLSLMAASKRQIENELPLAVKTRDFIMVQTVARGVTLPLSASKLFRDSVLELKNELMPDALPPNAAYNYITALKRNDEFKCLQYEEHHERFKVKIKTDQLIDMSTGRFDFWIEAEVELFDYSARRGVLI